MFGYLSIPMIVCIVGALLWGLASEKYPKLVEAGRLMFFAGLFVTLLAGVHRP